MQVVSALNLNRAWGEGRKVDGSAGERGREREGEGGGGWGGEVRGGGGTQQQTER